LQQPDLIPAHPAPGRAEQNATRIVFFFLGFILSAWAPLVPFAKDRAGLDAGGLGLLLLCLGLGSLVSMPLAGAVTTRAGCRATILASGIAAALLFPLLAFVADPYLLAAALFLFGIAIGLAEVGVNVQSVIVAKAASRPLLSGFHGLFSVGGIVGAGGVSLLIWLGLSPLLSAFVVVALIAVQFLIAAPHLIPYGQEDQAKTPLFVAPRGIVLFIGALSFIVFLAESAMLDWSALYLIGERAFSVALAGTGYAAFAGAMTVGRLTGDRIVAALGGFRVLVWSGLVATIGFAVAVFLPHGLATLAGFALIGLGASNIVPVFYSLIGRQRVMPPGHAIAAVTAMGYAGILIGPAFIGFIAQATSLPVAFGVVGLLMLVVPLTARMIARS
jgi:predicted MFS family arabinose efflux permease